MCYGNISICNIPLTQWNVNVFLLIIQIIASSLFFLNPEFDQHFDLIVAFWKWKADASHCQIGNVLSFSTLWPNMEMLLHNRLHITNLRIIHLSLFYNVLGNHLLIILFFSVSLIIINKTFSFSLIVILLLSILLFFSHFALCVLLKIVLSYYGRYEFYVNIL